MKGSESSLFIISVRAVAICGCSAVSFLIQKLVILSFPGDDQFFFFLMLDYYYYYYDYYYYY